MALNAREESEGGICDSPDSLEDGRGVRLVDRTVSDARARLVHARVDEAQGVVNRSLILRAEGPVARATVGWGSGGDGSFLSD